MMSRCRDDRGTNSNMSPTEAEQRARCSEPIVRRGCRCPRFRSLNIMADHLLGSRPCHPLHVGCLQPATALPISFLGVVGGVVPSSMHGSTRKANAFATTKIGRASCRERV